MIFFVPRSIIIIIDLYIILSSYA